MVRLERQVRIASAQENTRADGSTRVLRQRVRKTVADLGVGFVLALTKFVSGDYDEAQAQTPTPIFRPADPTPTEPPHATAIRRPTATMAPTILPTSIEQPTAPPTSTRRPTPTMEEPTPRPPTPTYPSTVTPELATSTLTPRPSVTPDHTAAPTSTSLPTSTPQIIRETQIALQTVVVPGTPVVIRENTIELCERDPFGRYFRVVRERTTGAVINARIVPPPECALLQVIPVPQPPRVIREQVPVTGPTQPPQVIPGEPRYIDRPVFISPPVQPTRQPTPRLFVPGIPAIPIEPRIAPDERPELPPRPTPKPEELVKLPEKGEPISPLNPLVPGVLLWVGALVLGAVRRFRP